MARFYNADDCDCELFHDNAAAAAAVSADDYDNDDGTQECDGEKPPNQRTLYNHHLPPQVLDHTDVSRDCNRCLPPPKAPHMSKPLLSPIDIPPSSPPCAPPAVCFAIDFLAFRAAHEERKQNTSKRRIES
jgi:hypothetical protein